ncbi:MAG: DUF4131 domain-containing protein, partial [Acetobacteraceae bacterium]
MLRLATLLRGALTWLLSEWEGEQGRGVLWLPVLMGAGVLTYDSLRFEPWRWTGAALAAATAMGLLLTRRWSGPRLVLWPLLAYGLGFAAIQAATARAPPVDHALPRHAVIVTGRVVTVEPLPNSRRVTLEAAILAPDRSEPMVRTVRVRLKATDDGPVGTGDTIRVRAMLRPIGPPTYPGGWDMQRDAFYAGLAATGYALGPTERVTEAVPTAPLRWIQRLRETIANRIVAALPGTEGRVAVGILIGSPTGIPPEAIGAFRDSGLAHLLAVS